MSGFTKGPWVIRDGGLGMLEIVPSYDRRGPHERPGLPVAVIYNCHNRTIREDAALVSAAPELFEALEDAQQALAHALSVTAGIVQPSTRIALEFAESKASEAIRKAKEVSK